MAETASRTYPISSSYQFPSEIKQFTPGKRNTYHIRVENGDIYIFKTYRPEDEEDDRLEYIPEDELEVYNYSPPPLQGTYIPICYGLVKMDGMSGLLLGNCGSKTYEEFPRKRNE